jgi:Arc/MetJ-type ribon-helix-helix transcriptional regulator
MLSVEVQDSCVKAIDAVVASSGLYSSRSEFLKDSIRKNLAETTQMSDSLKSIRRGAEKLAAEARKRGYKGGLPTREERDKLAREYMKELGIKF